MSTETKPRDKIEEIWRSRPDGNGCCLMLYAGPSVKPYPGYIASKDEVFYVNTSGGKYRFRLEDQEQLMDAVLGNVVLQHRRAEKALRLINTAEKHLNGQQQLWPVVKNNAKKPSPKNLLENLDENRGSNSPRGCNQ